MFLRVREAPGGEILGVGQIVALQIGRTPETERLIVLDVLLLMGVHPFDPAAVSERIGPIGDAVESEDGLRERPVPKSMVPEEVEPRGRIAERDGGPERDVNHRRLQGRRSRAARR